ncbi:WD40-repeat-containing domain protein [Paraphysoderma sedebokerense]|nr:WD40-repeat-containing domain protein [Paraphysoderma sedebokerense]
MVQSDKLSKNNKSVSGQTGNNAGTKTSKNAIKSNSSSRYGSNAQIASKSKRGSVLQPAKPEFRLVDQNGVDVTPLPLLPNPKKGGGGVNPNQSNTDVSGGLIGTGVPGGSTAGKITMMSAMDFFTSVESQTSTGMGSSMFGKSFGSVNQNSSRMSNSSMTERSQDDNSSVSSIGSVDDGGDSPARDSPSKLLAEITPSHLPSLKPTAPKEITEAELSRIIKIMLSETETMWLLDLPGTYVSPDSTDYAAVSEANARYQALLTSKSSSNNYVDRGAQTFSLGVKHKDVQATLIKQANADCNVTEWSIYDAYSAEEEASMTTGIDADGGPPNRLSSTDVDLPSFNALGSAASGITSNALMSSSMATNSVSMFSANMLTSESGNQSMLMDDNISEAGYGTNGGPGLNATGDGTKPAAGTGIGAIAGAGRNMLGDVDQGNLRESLRVVESAVLQNTYMKRLLNYRNISEEISNQVTTFESHIPSLQFLWSFRCDLTRDRTVTYMAWNKQDKDILAVAYSEQASNSYAPQGLICCWSLKNLEYPERIYKSQSASVICVEFSSSNPSLLAAGFSDGRIAIYDVRDKQDKSVLDSRNLDGKHREAVWDLKWVTRDQISGEEQQSQGESLITISTDGRVSRWQIKKGLEVTDLMTLKSVTKQSEGGKVTNTEGSTKSWSNFITRMAGGLCFDFNGEDSNMYLVGTEDGTIHRCSCSYNEQYLNTYLGHTAPVYKVKWSPFYSKVFLSCSADWTVKLWEVEKEEPVVKFISGKDSISGIAWSPKCSTIYGSVSNDGKIEIWDLKHSVLDPAIVHTVLDQSLTSIIFSEDSPVVLIGDISGCVNVYKLRNLDFMTGKSREEQISVLEEIVKGTAKAGGDEVVSGEGNDEVDESTS